MTYNKGIHKLNTSFLGIRMSMRQQSDEYLHLVVMTRVLVQTGKAEELVAGRVQLLQYLGWKIVQDLKVWCQKMLMYPGIREIIFKQVSI